MKPSLVALRNVLEPDFYRIKKRVPLLLKGGYREFSQKYPSLCDTYDLSRIPPKPMSFVASLHEHQKSSNATRPIMEGVANKHLHNVGSIGASPAPPYHRNFSDYVSLYSNRS
jgi:hypothetical protein